MKFHRFPSFSPFVVAAVCTIMTCTSGPTGGVEQCDDGAENSDTQPGACRTDCTTPAACALVIGVTSDDRLGALQYEMSYANVAGELVATGAAVHCRSLVAGGFASFNDDDEARVLFESIISPGGFDGPPDVLECTFVPAGPEPLPADFPVTLLAASGPNFEDATPAVAVTSVSCSMGPDGGSQGSATSVGCFRGGGPGCVQ